MQFINGQKIFIEVLKLTPFCKNGTMLCQFTWKRSVLGSWPYSVTWLFDEDLLMVTVWVDLRARESRSCRRRERYQDSIYYRSTILHVLWLYTLIFVTHHWPPQKITKFGLTLNHSKGQSVSVWPLHCYIMVLSPVNACTAKRQVSPPVRFHM